MIHAFIFGIILGFGLIMPLGIQNVFLFNQGATQRHFLHAMPSVIAAFLCDAVLITVAVLGVSIVVLQLAWFKIILFVVGFFFLLFMGWKTWRNHPSLNTNSQPLTAKQQIAFALAVSVLNPHAIIDSIAIIGTNSLNFAGTDRWAFMFACILVSFSWFFGLAVAGHTVHKLDTTGKWIARINKLSALIIWSVAAYLAWQLFQMFIGYFSS